MRLRADLCLIKLAPPADLRVTPSGLLTAPAMPTPTCYGKVVLIGRTVQDVAVGDVVAFRPSVGEPLDWLLFPTPHLLLSVNDIDAIVPPRERTSV